MMRTLSHQPRNKRLIQTLDSSGARTAWGGWGINFNFTVTDCVWVMFQISGRRKDKDFQQECKEESGDSGEGEDKGKGDGEGYVYVYVIQKEDTGAGVTVTAFNFDICIFG